MTSYIRVSDYVALVDDADYERLNRIRWQVHTKRNGTLPYAVFNTEHKGKPVSILMHRIVLGALTGFMVDHINGNTLDNRKSNLRIALPIESVWNQKIRVRGTSRFRGVTWRKEYNYWEAAIRHNNRRLHLGTFASEEEAARAYDVAVRKFRGAFGHTNFPG